MQIAPPARSGQPGQDPEGQNPPWQGPEHNAWLQAVQRNPGHARAYAQRWRDLAAAGNDIVGEARTVDAMLERQSLVLDAGCGTGRVGGYLAERGHQVVGIDLDPELIEVARADAPSGTWLVGNLADFTLLGTDDELLGFDLVVMAGQVMTFLAGAERRPALERIAAHLASDGRFICGFGAGRGYAFDQFLRDAEASGLALQARYSTWTLRPPAQDFLVAVFGRA